MTISQRLEQVRDRIAAAARSAGRQPDEVRLVAVSKTVGADRIREAVTTGQLVFGENYVQEAREKIDSLAEDRLTWHMIGRLQSNKAKQAVSLFDLIHSVDSLKLAQAINAAAARIHKVQSILIQVNVAGDTAKAGVTPEAATDLVHDADALDHVRVIGLMTMPPYFDDPQRARPAFAALRRLMAEINAGRDAGGRLTELSMGMSGDMTAAVAEGATLVRIGTAIFGGRS